MQKFPIVNRSGSASVGYAAHSKHSQEHIQRSFNILQFSQRDMAFRNFSILPQVQKVDNADQAGR